MPINVLGSPAAVLHAVATSDDATPVVMRTGVRMLEGVASRFGDRLGMLRAMSKSKLQAETDPLTGLLNRRAMENAIRELRHDGVRFALAMADLDHFKDLNDTYGHDTGDRALRVFARVMQSAVRDGDLVCRYGGEEFVIILADADATVAAPVLHRLRERLAEALRDADLPVFSVSLGLVDTSCTSDLRDLLRAADRALLTAKAEGRDRLVIAEETGCRPPHDAGIAEVADMADAADEAPDALV